MQTAIFAVPVLAATCAVHLSMLAGATVAALRARAARAAKARRAGRPRSPDTASPRRRRISVLKPLAGNDDDLAANLASFATLDHLDYEVLFGVVSLTDPAVPVVRALLRRFPAWSARLVITDPYAATNPKVAQLVGLSAEATGDVFVISDSNVRVSPDYLASLERELDVGHDVGLVTSLFVGTGEASFGAALENLQLSSFVAPAVAASSLLSKRPLTVGKSMAVTRAAHEAIGGFAAVGGVLAEDHLLGRLVSDAGFEVRLAFAPVENRNVTCDVSRALERHSRWAKMRRAICPVSFCFEPLGDPLLIAALTALVLPSRLTLVALAFVLPWRIATAYLTTWLLRGRPLALRYLPLELARSALSFYCWARACVSRRIVWRGHPFVLGPDSAIAPAPPARVRRPKSA